MYGENAVQPEPSELTNSAAQADISMYLSKIFTAQDVLIRNRTTSILHGILEMFPGKCCMIRKKCRYKLIKKITL
jgi:hypothetical protein